MAAMDADGPISLRLKAHVGKVGVLEIGDGILQRSQQGSRPRLRGRALSGPVLVQQLDELVLLQLKELLGSVEQRRTCAALLIDVLQVISRRLQVEKAHLNLTLQTHQNPDQGRRNIAG